MGHFIKFVVPTQFSAVAVSAELSSEIICFAQRFLIKIKLEMKCPKK